MIKINLKSLQEDLRKIGIALMLAGFADLFFNDNSYLYSSYIVLSGGVFWTLGIIEKINNQKGK
jgi:hypothetical protein